MRWIFAITVWILLWYNGTCQSNTLIETPVEISEWIDTGANKPLTEDQLIFIDFWATWCAPCSHSMPNVDRLLKQFGDDVFFISMTDEGPIAVEKFLPKHSPQTAIALDYEKATSKYFNIHSIPMAVLIDATGEEVWRGHPTELSQSAMRGFIQRSSRRTPFRTL